MTAPIAVSIGDVAGIGPEVTLKALREFPDESFVLVGPENIIRKSAVILGEKIDRHSLIDTGIISEELLFSGSNSSLCGRASHDAAESALQLAIKGESSAVVTAPISKAAWHLAGFDDAGHTELIQRVTGKRTVMTFTGRLASPDDMTKPLLRLALATTHIPLCNVPSAVTFESILETIAIIRNDLLNYFEIANPRIVVTGLNPHAGESGNIGSEEEKVIKPAIAEARTRGWNVTGPVPADTAFTKRSLSSSDIILAMYHDQGLAPFKALTAGQGVNLTMGAGLIRTSPDHGTAFEIAGKDKADPSSMRQAILLAKEMAGN